MHFNFFNYIGEHIQIISHKFPNMNLVSPIFGAQINAAKQCTGFIWTSSKQIDKQNYYQIPVGSFTMYVNIKLVHTLELLR